MLQKRYDDAAREFEEALAINANHFDALYFYARAAFAHGDIERSAKLFRRAGEARREAGVLPFFADGERQLVIRHDHLGSSLVLIEAHVLDPRRAERFGDEALRIGSPFDDVDLLASQLVDDLPHTRTAGAHTSTDGIDVGIVRRHGDLGAVSGLSSDRLDLDSTVDELWYLQLQQPAQVRLGHAGDDRQGQETLEHIHGQPRGCGAGLLRQVKTAEEEAPLIVAITRVGGNPSLPGRTCEKFPVSVRRLAFD